MAHETGSVNSLADLLAAIRAACVDHGWTLSGEVLHKGDAYIRSQIVSGFIEWRGGTGKDGSNNLTGAAPDMVRNGDFGTRAITYPCTWEAHIHEDPDEVYIVLNYNVDYYQYAAWGLSNIAGLPGTGMWFGASRLNIAGGGGGANADFLNQLSQTGSLNSNLRGAPLFYASGSAGGTPCQTTYLHHGLDSGTWSSNAGGASNYPRSFNAIGPLLAQLPNAWNGETVLLPFPVYLPRTTGNKNSLVADLRHIRHCRIDFHDPGDIVTLGSDHWKLYPGTRKNVVDRNATNAGADWTHSGTFAFAVRYDGSV